MRDVHHKLVNLHLDQFHTFGDGRAGYHLSVLGHIQRLDLIQAGNDIHIFVTILVTDKRSLYNIFTGRGLKGIRSLVIASGAGGQRTVRSHKGDCSPSERPAGGLVQHRTFYLGNILAGGGGVCSTDDQHRSNQQ